MLIRHAHRTVIAADHTKLGHSFFISITRPTEIDTIITDSNADTDMVNSLREKGINMELV